MGIEALARDEQLETEYQTKFNSWARNAFLNNSCVDYANMTWFVRRTQRALKEATGDGRKFSAAATVLVLKKPENLSMQTKYTNMF